MRIKTADRVNKVLPYLFADLELEQQRRVANGEDVIFLSVGDPDLPPPQPILDEFKKSISIKSNNAYTISQGIPPFRAAAAKWQSERFNLKYEADDVCHLMGAKEAFHHLSRAYCEKGDYVIIPCPGYPAYANGAGILADTEIFRASLLKKNDFLIDFDSIPTQILKKSKILILNYPNNPTGAIATSEFYKKVKDYAEDYNFLVVSDNPYSEITFDGYEAPSFLEYSKDHIEINSFSKTFNMPGYRLAFAIGNREVIDALIKVKSQIDSGGPIFIQHAGIAGFEMYKNGKKPTEIIKNCEIYKERRDLVVSRLRNMGITVDTPKATIYVWAECPEKLKKSFDLNQRLMDGGVMVTPGAGFGPESEGYFRIALVEPLEKIKTAMDRMEKVIKSL